MRIAVMGAGSIGTIVGAYLSAQGLDVDLITRNRAQVEALNQFGARITGATEWTVPVRALTPDQMKGTYDLVLFFTKQGQNHEVLKHLLGYLGPQSIVCSLQNGIPEADIAAIVGPERVIGGSIEFGATGTLPGVSRLTTSLEHLKQYAFQIGELNGQITDRIHVVQSILAHVGGTHISQNLVGTKWSKLWLNVTFGGLSAALGATFGEVIDNDVALRSAVFLSNETLKVGHACSVQFAPLFRFDVESCEIYQTKDVIPYMEMLRRVISPGRAVKSSILQDLEKNRPTEISYINGVITRLGKEKGIPTPFNHLVVKLVRQAEKTHSLPTFSRNLRFFKELLTQESF
ncbi:ketopantoate reductase family protein [Sulfobacillus thermosulfidooxidans]|uniref:ketopantoate reductase family protein n=1 Tax=Sulfobacillus thermosulfidooxidans TaxID=28034 RepID=UPI0006B4B42B|nr:2-dehydropantoate 2-reductase [Sulfobacillus thermosulfidooxidans]